MFQAPKNTLDKKKKEKKKETPRFIGGILQKQLGGWGPVNCAALKPGKSTTLYFLQSVFSSTIITPTSDSFNEKFCPKIIQGK